MPLPALPCTGAILLLRNNQGEDRPEERGRREDEQGATAPILLSAEMVKRTVAVFATASARTSGMPRRRR